MADNRVWLSLLSEEALRAIEETAYRLLDQVGISLQHPAAIEMLHGRGYRVDTGRVFIPSHVVQWALQNVTAHRRVYRLDGSLAHTYGDGQVCSHTGGGPLSSTTSKPVNAAQPYFRTKESCARPRAPAPTLASSVPLQWMSARPGSTTKLAWAAVCASPSVLRKPIRSCATRPMANHWRSRS